MKTLKLITGILSIVFTAVVLFQSCAAGLYNTLESNGESSGFAGFAVAILMIAGGIIMIATRGAAGKGGSVAACVVFGIAALLGFVLAGSFADLNIWAGWCAIMAVLSLISALRSGKKSGREEADT